MRILRKVRLRSPVWEITTAKISVARIAGLPIVQMPTLKFKEEILPSGFTCSAETEQLPIIYTDQTEQLPVIS